MSSEREIVTRLFESKSLDEKTYTVGDTQYWKRGGKCYSWTSSGGKRECSEDEYMKAISGGKDEPVKNTDPANDKAREDNTSSHKIGDELKLGDWSYTKVDNDTWETTYKGKKQEDRTDADIARVFSGADSEDKLIKNMSLEDLRAERANIKSKLSAAEESGNEKGISRFSKDLDKYDKELKSRLSAETKRTTPKKSAKEDFHGPINSYEIGKTGNNEKDMRVLKNTEVGATVKIKYFDNSIEYARKTDDNTWETDDGARLSDNDVATVAWEGGKAIINRMVKNKPANDKPKEDKAREFIKPERDHTDSSRVSHDGIDSFDHTTWDLYGMDTTITQNPVGVGYYLQNEEFDMEFANKADLVRYLKREKATFAGYDSENDY